MSKLPATRITGLSGDAMGGNSVSTSLATIVGSASLAVATKLSNSSSSGENHVCMTGSNA